VQHYGYKGVNLLINSRNIEDLHPTLKRGATELIKRMHAKGYPLGISSTYRCNKSQNALFNQVPKVTNARGGESMHNYRLAFDIFKNIKGQEFNDNAFFNTAGKIWQEMGGEWGGSWVGFKDAPHMQYTEGLTLKSLQSGTKVPPNAKMKWEDVDVIGDDKVLYITYSDVPDWGKPTIKKLMEKKFLNGDDKGNINLTESMLRILIIHDRVGLYDMNIKVY
jgi:hypothetical protein